MSIHFWSDPGSNRLPRSSKASLRQIGCDDDEEFYYEDMLYQVHTKMPEMPSRNASCSLPECEKHRCMTISKVIEELWANKEPDSSYNSSETSSIVFPNWVDNMKDNENSKCERKKKLLTFDDTEIPDDSCSGSQSSNTSKKSVKQRPPKKRKRSPSSGLPLTKVLCNMREAMNIDNECTEKINALMEAQKELQNQIANLEKRETKGMQKLKRADDLWTLMEEQYKKLLKESKMRQDDLVKQLKELDNDTKKWKNDQENLKSKIKYMEKLNDEIKNKIQNKSNDMKTMDLEIEDFKKRIDSIKKEIESFEKSCNEKKIASEDRIAKIQLKRESIQKQLDQVQKDYDIKEKEATRNVKEARAELSQAGKDLFLKKLENKQLNTEKINLIEEIAELKEAIESNDAKSKIIDKSLDKEKQDLIKEIKNTAIKCVQCHQQTYTDVRNPCTECPRCLIKRDCKIDSGHCEVDPASNCVCMKVKEMFLDNVFDNMCSILDYQTKTEEGKAISDVVYKSLMKTKNGKIDPKTRKLLQDFILTTVKKDLDLTIVGGAVKTRCEMDQETYDQLMLCLKDVKVSKLTLKEDRKENDKKDPCSRFERSTGCNCPGGPEKCECSKKAPPTQSPPQADTISTTKSDKDKVDDNNAERCGKKANPCGSRCVKETYTTSCSRWPSCTVSKYVRSRYAQYPILIPSNMRYFTHKSYGASTVSEVDLLNSREIPTQKCSYEDVRRSPRQRMVEEVIGKYSDVTPIETVNFVDNLDFECTYLPLKYLLRSPKKKISCSIACPSNNGLEVESLFKKKPSVNEVQNVNRDQKSISTTDFSRTSSKQIQFENLYITGSESQSIFARSSMSCESLSLRLKESYNHNIHKTYSTSKTKIDESQQERNTPGTFKNILKDDSGAVWLTKTYSDKENAFLKDLKPPSNDTLLEKELISENFATEGSNTTDSKVPSVLLENESIRLQIHSLYRIETRNFEQDLTPNYTTNSLFNDTNSKEDIKLDRMYFQNIRKCLRNTGEGASRNFIKYLNNHKEFKSSPTLVLENSHRQNNNSKKTRICVQKRPKLVQY